MNIMKTQVTIIYYVLCVTFVISKQSYRHH